MRPVPRTTKYIKDNNYNIQVQTAAANMITLAGTLSAGMPTVPVTGGLGKVASEGGLHQSEPEEAKSREAGRSSPLRGSSEVSVAGREVYRRWLEVSIKSSVIPELVHYCVTLPCHSYTIWHVSYRTVLDRWHLVCGLIQGCSYAAVGMEHLTLSSVV
jgi:hypothetical protein